MEDQLLSSQNSDLNNDLALCIDNIDNQMTFVGHTVYLYPESPDHLRTGCNVCKMPPYQRYGTEFGDYRVIVVKVCNSIDAIFSPRNSVFRHKYK